MKVTAWREWEHGPYDKNAYNSVSEVVSLKRVHLVPTSERTRRESQEVMRKLGAPLSGVSTIDSHKTRGNSSQPSAGDVLRWAAEHEGIVLNEWPTGKGKNTTAYIVFRPGCKPADRVKAVGILSAFVKRVLEEFHPWVETKSLNNHSCVIEINDGTLAMLMESNFDLLNKTTTIGRGYSAVKEEANFTDILGVKVMQHKPRAEK
jgi:hypothetical protein